MAIYGGATCGRNQPDADGGQPDRSADGRLFRDRKQCSWRDDQPGGAAHGFGAAQYRNIMDESSCDSGRPGLSASLRGGRRAAMVPMAVEWNGFARGNEQKFAPVQSRDQRRRQL